MDPKTGYFEHKGWTMYSQKNYNPTHYTHKNMSKLGHFKLALKDLYGVVKASKAQCLHNAGRDVEEPMFAIEKDEEYLPEFKTCVKDLTVKFQDARNAFAEANPKKPIFRYTLNEE